MSTHANFTYQTRLYFFAVFIYNRNIIKGRGFTHGTRLRGGPRQIGQSQSCLGLPKTFVQFESGILIKTVVNFWIERFACSSGILE